MRIFRTLAVTATAATSILIAAPAMADDYYGDSYDNTYYGTTHSDTMHGYEGYDTLFGKRGSDYLFGGDDDDSLYGGRGRDYLEGDDGSDYLSAGTDYRRDVIDGGSGYDTIEVSGSDDVWAGSDGDTVYVDWANSDMDIDCGSGYDTVYFYGYYPSGVSTSSCEYVDVI